MEDKKPKLEDDAEPAEVTANVHYTDSYGSTAREANLWFLNGLTTKDMRKTMADQMANRHRSWKIDAIAGHMDRLLVILLSNTKHAVPYRHELECYSR